MAGADKDQDELAGTEQPFVSHLVELRDRLIEDGEGQVVHRVAVFDRRQEVAGDDERAVGLAPAHERLDADDPGRLQPDLRLEDRLDLTGAKRMAQAMTRLERIAVLVQNSSVVGPRSNVASSATRTPKTALPTWPSGTVLGSGIMKKANAGRMPCGERH